MKMLSKLLVVVALLAGCGLDESGTEGLSTNVQALNVTLNNPFPGYRVYASVWYDNATGHNFVMWCRKTATPVAPYWNDLGAGNLTGHVTVNGSGLGDTFHVASDNSTVSCNGFNFAAMAPHQNGWSIQMNGGAYTDDMWCGGNNSGGIVMFGGADNDFLWGVAAFCSLHGGPGADKIHTWSGGQVVAGEEGADCVDRHGYTAFSLSCGSDNDYLVGGTTSDCETSASGGACN